jgi:hypothetical protein
MRSCVKISEKKGFGAGLGIILENSCRTNVVTYLLEPEVLGGSLLATFKEGRLFPL